MTRKFYILLFLVAKFLVRKTTAKSMIPKTLCVCIAIDTNFKPAETNETNIHDIRNFLSATPYKAQYKDLLDSKVSIIIVNIHIYNSDSSIGVGDTTLKMKRNSMITTLATI